MKGEKQEKRKRKILEEAIGKNLLTMFDNFLIARVASENIRDEGLAKQAIAVAVALLAPDHVPPELTDLAKEGLKILQTRLPK